MKKNYIFLLLTTIILFTDADKLFSQTSVSILEDNALYRISLVTPRIVNTVPVGSEEGAYLRIINKQNHSLNLDASMMVVDFKEDTLSFSDELRVAASDSTEYHFPDEIFAEKGIKWISMVTGTGGNEASFDFALAYMDPVGNDYQSDFNFGVAGIRYNSEEELDWLYSAAKQVGVQYERKYASWNQIQPKPDVWRWEKLDHELQALENHNMSRQLLLTGTPSWAANEKYADREKKGNVPPQINYWRKYVHEIARRYQGKVRYYEIWNEPDIGFFAGTTDEYVEMLKSAWEEIKNVNPDLQVLSGGFAQATPRQNIFKERGDLHKDAVRLGQDYFDVHAFHRHGPFAVFKYEVDGPLREIRSQLKSPKPMWFNETAMHSTSIGQKEQAKILFQKLSFAMARDAVGYCWFSLKNNTHAPITSPERHYGMIKGDNSPKAVYLVYNQMVKNLYDKKFIRELDPGKGFEAFLYGKKGEYLINAWKQEASIPDQLAVFKVDDGCRVIVSDLMGNGKEYKVSNGKVIVPVHSEGSFIKFLSCKDEPVYLTSLLSFREIITANQNNEVIIPLNLQKNVLKTPVISVIDKGSVVKKTNAKKKKKMLVRTGSQNLILLIKDSSSAFSEKMNVPVSSPLVIKTNAPKENTPIQLDSYDHVVNLFEHDPNTEHLTWKGPDDLSLRSWIRLDDDYLTLRFKVKDDVHYQTNTGRSQTRGDGVHFAIRIPDKLGFWDMGISMNNKGEPDFYIWSSPAGFDLNQHSPEKIKVKRQSPFTLYEVKIRLDEFGLSNIKNTGMYYTFLINDNDGERREGWIQYTPGLGGGKDLNKFKYVIFK